MLSFLFFLVSAYFIGSICSAIIVCRLFHLPDPRNTGSKNPGTTNVLRIAGKPYAILVLVTDMLKGLIPVLVAHAFVPNTMLLGFICLASILGHIYPVFFGFKGGKGVATALGVLLGFQWSIGLAAIITWLIVASLSRYSSLAAMTALVLTPLYVWIGEGSIMTCLPFVIIASIILYKHKENIIRLSEGKESRIQL